MALMVSAVTRNIIFWDYINQPTDMFEKFIGTITDDDIRIILRDAKQWNLNMLGFLNYAENTVFNRKQVEQLRPELEILKKKSMVRKEAIQIIEKGIEMVVNSNRLYLQFEGD